MDRWQAFVNVIMNRCALYVKGGEFLDWLVDDRFLKKEYHRRGWLVFGRCSV
jgi:hypothetical protein